MTNSYTVRVSKVWKQFGKDTALNNVSLDLEHGEFFSLLGPSGCGKSTLLRIIAGFETPTRGEVEIQGVPTIGVPANKRPVNMVFQNYAIFPHLNVKDNVAFGLRRSTSSRKEIDRRVAAALEKVDLAGWGQRDVERLSGGQRQRVALARALILEPKVLLLDEPLSALDKKLREQMQIELRRLQRSLNITFLMVTHDQEEAMAISDRCGVMFNGNLVQVDTPEKLYERPISRQVADFIGGMNFFDGEVIGATSRTVDVKIPRLGHVRMQGGGADMVSGQAVTVAIRPERLRIRHKRPGEMEAATEAVVRESTFRGEIIHYLLELPHGNDVIVVSVRSASGEGLFQDGDTVFIGFNGDDAILLPLEP